MWNRIEQEMSKLGRKWMESNKMTTQQLEIKTLQAMGRNGGKADYKCNGFYAGKQQLSRTILMRLEGQGKIRRQLFCYKLNTD